MMVDGCVNRLITGFKVRVGSAWNEWQAAQLAQECHNCFFGAVKAKNCNPSQTTVLETGGYFPRHILSGKFFAVMFRQLQ